MADRVQFELVTPERLLVSQDVEMVVVPGSEGNFGVLPGHSPLISTIARARSTLREPAGNRTFFCRWRHRRSDAGGLYRIGR